MKKSFRLNPEVELSSGHKLKELLGKGGFAEVWQAEDAKGRQLALKFIPCRSDLAAAKEIRSLQAIHEVKHPNLIRIEQVWCDRGHVIIAMELADGSLLDLLQKYQQDAGMPIVAEQLMLYLAQAAQALDHFNARQHSLDGHKVGFQHCDIKPSNLLLFDDVVKLSDFGLASATGASLRAHRRAGTLQYAAPEVFQGRLSDWTDQYSLAITYVQLRTGKLPFAHTPSSFKHEYVRPAPDLTLLPEAERPIIARALASAPQDRWPSCMEMIRRLVLTLGEEPARK